MWTRITPNGKVKYCEKYTDYLTGKRKDVSVTFDKDTSKNRKEAQLILSEKIKRTGNVQDNPQEITLSQLVDEYRKEQINTVRASTYKRNFFALETIKNILNGDILVNKLNARYIRDRFLSTGKPGSTLNEHLRRFKALIHWGYTVDLINDISFLNKIDRFPDVTHKDKISEKFLESSELKLLLANMRHPVWNMLTEFLSLSGLRCGEAIALEKSDIDLKNKIIHITKTYDHINKVINPAKTVNSIDDVTIQPQLEKIIKKINFFMKCQQVEYGYKTKLFMSDIEGNYIHYQAYNVYFRKQTKKIIGKALTTHSLRHTHASFLFEQGFTLDEVARRLRHGNSSITREVYIHITQKLREKDAEKLMNVKLI